MSGRVTDDALSEVIGFILIIAIIVILGSLYMTYVVPSQGRDAEIQHMQEVEKFFTDFKMNMDSLWLNDQVGVSFNQILNLGTGGQTSSGSFSVFPVMQPVSSYGTVRVIPDNPKMSLKIHGMWLSNESSSDEIEETQIADPNTLLVVNYDTEINTRSIPNTLVIYSTNGDWTATLEIVNETFLLPGDINWNVTPQGYVTNLSFSKDSQNVLALSISKNGYKTLDRMRINSTIGEIKRNYSINLLDEAYGLHDDVKFPFGVNYSYFNNGIPINKRDNPFQLLGYKKMEKETIIPIGDFSYESSNKYWINQDYLYTLGGVFLNQGGIQSYRLKPWIMIEQKPGYEGGPVMIPDVNLNILSISQISGNLSGPDNVQISSKLLDINNEFEDIHQSNRGFVLSNLRPNAAYVFINITNVNPDISWGNSWNQTLTSIVKDSGINPGYYKIFPPIIDSNGCTVSLGVFGNYGIDGGGILNITPDLYVNYESIESEISISGPVYV